MLLQPGDNDCCRVGVSETVVEKMVVSFSGRSKPEPEEPLPLAVIEIASSAANVQ